MHVFYRFPLTKFTLERKDSQYGDPLFARVGNIFGRFTSLGGLRTLIMYKEEASRNVERKR